jgi:hypothetical protein
MSGSSIFPANPAQKLTAVLREALSLINEISLENVKSSSAIAPEPALLEQCLAMCEEHRGAKKEPIRTLHHFACTGGTLISRCIAAMPNVQLLSEIDPLSSLLLDPNSPRFAPSDPVTLLRQSPRRVDSRVLLRIFREELRVIYEESTAIGQHLVLRDHAHSQFCTTDSIVDRPTVRDLVSEAHSVVSLLTVRHPLDSYASLIENGWVHFQPKTFDEYCRRYLAFVSRYEDVPCITYEAFVADPASCMASISHTFALDFNPDFLDCLDVISLTGDSGRKGMDIERRPARGEIARLAQEASSSSAYFLLCHKLQYEPNVDLAKN